MLQTVSRLLPELPLFLMTANPVQDAPRGQGLVRGALSGLAHQRDRSDLQAPGAERRAVKRGPARGSASVRA
jgi:hypothetical protein